MRGQDQIVCAEDTGGEVAIFNISAGKATQITGPLGKFFPYGTTFTGGVTVAAGNFDGIVPQTGVGTDDVITGEAKGQPLVRVFTTRIKSGKSVLDQEASFLAYAKTATGGITVAVGDLNGDGKADIVTGSGPGIVAEVKGFDAFTVKGLNGSSPPAMIVSGTTIDLKPYGTSFTGGVRVALLDLSGDGLIDNIVTAPGNKQNLAGNNVDLFDLALAQIGSFPAYGIIFPGGVYVGG